MRVRCLWHRACRIIRQASAAGAVPSAGAAGVYTLVLSSPSSIYRLFWSFTKKGEILKAGGSVDGLLEALQTSDEDVDPRYWLPV